MAKNELYEYQYTTPNKTVMKKHLPALRQPGDGGKKWINISGGGVCVGIAVFGILETMRLYFEEPSAAAFISMLLFGMLGGFGFRRLVVGNAMKQREDRYRIYLEAAAEKGYASVKELAKRAGRKEAKVLKDLKYMMDSKWFLEGHLDIKETCFMLSDADYRNYCNAEEARVLREQEEKRRQEILNDPVQKELTVLLKEGQEYLAQIHLLNVAIRDDKVSRQLDEMEDTSEKILEQVKKRPEKMPEIRKFMRYYLPMTIKVVTAYRDYEREDAPTAVIEESRREIEETLDKVKSAFQKLLEKISEEDVWDISTDLDVLETMMSQEGLLPDKL